MRHWLAVVGGTPVQFTGSSFQFQFLRVSICGNWTGASKTVVVYASRSLSNQLSINENGISEAITARTA